MDWHALDQSTNGILVLGNSRGLLSVWDSRSAQCILSWSVDERPVYVIRALGDRFFTAHDQGLIRLWKLAPWVCGKGDGSIENDVEIIKEFNLQSEFSILSLIVHERQGQWKVSKLLIKFNL